MVALCGLQMHGSCVSYTVILRRERYLCFKLKAALDQDRAVHTLPGWNLPSALRRQISWSMVLGRGYSQFLSLKEKERRKRKEKLKEVKLPKKTLISSIIFR